MKSPPKLKDILNRSSPHLLNNEMLRESIRARLRIFVRQALHKYKYPPDRTSYAVELMRKQAEIISNS